MGASIKLDCIRERFSDKRWRKKLNSSEYIFSFENVQLNEKKEIILCKLFYDFIHKHEFETKAVNEAKFKSWKKISVL